MWDECNCVIVWAFFGITLLWDWNENWPFQSCGHCWVFHICWHIECSTFTASSYRIWNREIGIPSPPLALFVVMLPKAHLTSHSWMSGPRWVITPSWLSVSWRSFMYSFSVYSCHLFLISFASVRSIPILSFIVPIFAWNVSLVSLIFLKRSLVYCFPISLHWSLRKAFFSLLAILWNSAFTWVYLSFSPLPFTSLLFSGICEVSSDNHFAFLHFFFLGMVLITDSCTMSQTSIHSSGTLSSLILWIYLSLLLHNHKGFDLGHSWMVFVFPYFLQYKSEFFNKDFMICTTDSSPSCFCWLYRQKISPSLAAKNIINLIWILTIWLCPCVSLLLYCWNIHFWKIKNKKTFLIKNIFLIKKIFLSKHFWKIRTWYSLISKLFALTLLALEFCVLKLIMPLFPKYPILSI